MAEYQEMIIFGTDLYNQPFFLIFVFYFAELAQLAERWLPKPKVAGSNPVFRSDFQSKSFPDT